MPQFSLLYNGNKKEFTSQKVVVWIKLILYGKRLENVECMVLEKS